MSTLKTAHTTTRGANALQETTTKIRPDRDLSVADEAPERDFACLVSVTHLVGADARRLRLVPGVTGVIDSEESAEVHMIVSATGHRQAQRRCVELVTGQLPQVVVTVPEVVDYNHALLSFLEQHGEHPDDADDLATFHDAHAVAEVLDRA